LQKGKSKNKIAKGNDCSTEQQYKEKRIRLKLKEQRNLGKHKRGKVHVISVQMVKFKIRAWCKDSVLQYVATIQWLLEVHSCCAVHLLRTTIHIRNLKLLREQGK